MAQSRHVGILGAIMVAVIASSGCSNETPVKYYVCDRGQTNCFLAARFKTMDSCKSHEKWSGMYCDSISEPGKMICREQPQYEATASSYCSR